MQPVRLDVRQPASQCSDSVDIITWDPNTDGAAFMPQRFTKEQIQVGDYAKTRMLINRLYPGRGKLLEVGSSFGFLLAEFKKDGWDVMGVEPYGAGCRFSDETHGIKVIHGILEEADIADETFDVVLLNHVIEHLDDPLATLRKINRVLKMNGHFVVETPRYDTLMYKLLGRRERSLSCNGHIYFFTTDTLKKLYEAAGFREVKLAYTGRSLTADRLAWNIGVMSKSERERVAGSNLAAAQARKGAALFEHERHAAGVRSKGCGGAESAIGHDGTAGGFADLIEALC